MNPGDEVIVPTPSFFFDIPVRLARGTPVYAKLNAKDNYSHDRRYFEKFVTKKTKMLTVCNPHNPSGRVLSEDELASLAELAIKHDFFLMHDQVYERMVFDGRPYIPLCRFREVSDRLISISSFSKLFNMINYRLGFAAGPQEVIRGMEMVQAFSSMGIPSLIQRGALAALQEEFEDRHLSQTVTTLQRARDYAINKLGSVEGIEVIRPEGTNLVFPNISAFGMNSMEFCKRLLDETGVACAPGAAYHGEGHIRISLGTDRIEEAIDRLVNFASGLPLKRKKKRIVTTAA